MYSLQQYMLPHALIISYFISCYRSSSVCCQIINWGTQIDFFSYHVTYIFSFSCGYFFNYYMLGKFVFIRSHVSFFLGFTSIVRRRTNYEIHLFLPRSAYWAECRSLHSENWKWYVLKYFQVDVQCLTATRWGRNETRFRWFYF